MPSPFPGMNPYLENENTWHNFHSLFPFAVFEMLVPQVRPKYYIATDEHVYIHELPDQRRRGLGKPDVSIAESKRKSSETPLRTESMVQTVPQRVTLPAVETERVPFIEIRDRENQRLVTIIELLSPSNKKRGADREQYELKRSTILASQTNLVEIDLLRAGPRFAPADETESDYCVLVSRTEDRPVADLWPISLRERLPEIPIPLNPGEAEVKLDLQAIVHRIYDVMGYEDRLYDASLQPPLRVEDIEWVAALVPQR